MFSLCENGYLRNWFLYFGKNEKPDPEEKQFKRRIGKSGAIVISFIKELFQHGYNIYIDNCYTSQSLFGYPYDHDTVVAGTAQRNKIDLPKSFKDKEPKKNKHDFKRNENLLAVKFQDKKEILLLSTGHTADIIQTGKKRSKWRKCSKNESNSSLQRKNGWSSQKRPNS